jgi:hypothetical protein
MPLLAANVATLTHRLGVPPVAVLAPGPCMFDANELVKLQFLRSLH